MERWKPTDSITTKLRQKYNLGQKVFDKCIESFQSFDRNGDGKISYEELEQATQLIGINHLAIQSKSEISEILRYADTNQDNHIEFEEYLDLLVPYIDQVVETSVTKQSSSKDSTYSSGSNMTDSYQDRFAPTSFNQQAPQSNIPESHSFQQPKLTRRQLFDVVDQDKNGEIDADEVFTLMTSLGIGVDENDVKEMMQGKTILDYSGFLAIVGDDDGIFPETQLSTPPDKQTRNRNTENTNPDALNKILCQCVIS